MMGLSTPTGRPTPPPTPAPTTTTAARVASDNILCLDGATNRLWTATLPLSVLSEVLIAEALSKIRCEEEENATTEPIPISTRFVPYNPRLPLVDVLRVTQLHVPQMYDATHAANRIYCALMI